MEFQTEWSQQELLDAGASWLSCWNELRLVLDPVADSSRPGLGWLLIRSKCWVMRHFTVNGPGDSVPARDQSWVAVGALGFHSFTPLPRCLAEKSLWIQTPSAPFSTRRDPLPHGHLHCFPTQIVQFPGAVNHRRGQVFWRVYRAHAEGTTERLRRVLKRCERDVNCNGQVSHRGV